MKMCVCVCVGLTHVDTQCVLNAIISLQATHTRTHTHTRARIRSVGHEHRKTWCVRVRQEAT